jgi:uncharacterized protein (DUF58 family)
MLLGGVRQQVTLAGLLYTVASILVGVAAFVSANNLLFLLLAAMLSTMMISGFVSRLSLAGLELDFVLPEHICARRRVSARLFIRNTKRWMPSFSIHVAGSPSTGMASTIYLPVIPGGTALEEPVDVSFSKRGSYKDNSFWVSTRFPFGFTERRVQVRLSREVIVYPAVDPQPGFEELLADVAGEIEQLFRGRGHDFYRIRPYEAFESARHVDWRATAHTGELQVREFAAEREHTLELFLDRDAGPTQAAWFERAIDCTAFLCWRVTEREARVYFRTQDFEILIPEEGDIYTILRFLALAAPAPGKRVLAPSNEHTFKLVISASPERAAEAGWMGARLLGPTAFPDPAGPGGAGPQFHHDRREDRR